MDDLPEVTDLVYENRPSRGQEMREYSCQINDDLALVSLPPIDSTAIDDNILFETSETITGRNNRAQPTTAKTSKRSTKERDGVDKADKLDEAVSNYSQVQNADLSNVASRKRRMSTNHRVSFQEVRRTKRTRRCEGSNVMASSPLSCNSNRWWNRRRVSRFHGKEAEETIHCTTPVPVIGGTSFVEHGFPPSLQVVYHVAHARLNAGHVQAAVDICHDELVKFYQQAESILREMLQNNEEQQQRGNQHQKTWLAAAVDIRQLLAGMWCVYAQILLEVGQALLEPNGRRSNSNSHRPIPWHEERQLYERYLKAHVCGPEVVQLPSLSNHHATRTRWSDFQNLVLNNLFQARACPLVGNHSWLSIALARLLVGACASAGRQDVDHDDDDNNFWDVSISPPPLKEVSIRQAILVCHDAVDSASPCLQGDAIIKPRFSWDKNNSEHTLERLLIYAGYRHYNVERSPCKFSVASLTTKLKCLCSVGYFVRDKISARELCAEVNRLSRLEEGVRNGSVLEYDARRSSQHPLDYLGFLQAVVSQSGVIMQGRRNKSIRNRRSLCPSLDECYLSSRIRQELVNPYERDSYSEAKDYWTALESVREPADPFSDRDGGDGSDLEDVLTGEHSMNKEEVRSSGLVSEVEFACTKCFKAGFKCAAERDLHQTDCNVYLWRSASDLSRRVSFPVSSGAQAEECSPEEVIEIIEYFVDLGTVTRIDLQMLENDEDMDEMPCLGQVGLRCRFCKRWTAPESFPQLVCELPDAMWRLCFKHLDACETMPRVERSVYNEFRHLLSASNKCHVEYWQAVASNMLVSRERHGQQGLFWKSCKKRVVKRKAPRNLLVR